MANNIPPSLKKEAQRIARLIFCNLKFDDAVEMISAALAAERDRATYRAQRKTKVKT
jgi:hypothetical protein